MRISMLASLVSGVLALSVSANATASASPASAPSASLTPGCATVTTYTPPSPTGSPFGVTEGPGGTWYADGDRIVRVRVGGAVDEFPLPDPKAANAGWLTWAGGDQVWFADRGTGQLGTVDTRGAVQEYPLPAGPQPSIGPGAMVVLGRTVWFTDPANARIGSFDMRTHHFTMYAVPTADSWPLGLTAGPDGALWFIERTAGKLGRMTLHGTFREWALAPDSFPNRIIVGPDHAIWFTELDAGLIGRMTMRGVLTQTPVVGGPVGITVGPDDRVYAALFTSHQLARLDAQGRVVKTWNVPGALLVATSHRALWLTDPSAGTVTQVRITRRCSQERLSKEPTN